MPGSVTRVKENKIEKKLKCDTITAQHCPAIYSTPILYTVYTTVYTIYSPLYRMTLVWRCDAIAIRITNLPSLSRHCCRVYCQTHFNTNKLQRFDCTCMVLIWAYVYRFCLCLSPWMCAVNGIIEKLPNDETEEPFTRKGRRRSKSKKKKRKKNKEKEKTQNNGNWTRQLVCVSVHWMKCETSIRNMPGFVHVIHLAHVTSHVRHTQITSMCNFVPSARILINPSRSFHTENHTLHKIECLKHGYFICTMFCVCVCVCGCECMYIEIPVASDEHQLLTDAKKKN